MLDTIPYIFFFALRADGKGVFLCIYRPGCFRTVRGRSEGNWQENRLLYSKYLTLQYILMRSRNRERGGSVGNSKKKRLFPAKITLIYPLFVACSPKSRLFPPFVAYSPNSCLFPPFVACSPKSRLFPPFAITNVLLSGFGRRNIATSNWRPAKLE